MSAPGAVVFCGPTMPATEASLRVAAEVRPPAALGDVYRAVRAGARVVGVIDGYFERVPAVWHKELLWAMSEGVHVLGAASMGALRAAELARFGMVGVGEIFADYRDGILEDDDEVAVAHGLADDGFAPTSIAMVNIRATLDRAVAEGVTDGKTRTELVALAKRLWYPDRTWAALLGAAQAAGQPALAALRRWLPGGAVDRKRDDALALLDAIGELLAHGPPPYRPSFRLNRTSFWEAARRELAAPTRPDTAPVARDRLLDELVLDPTRCAALRERALVRWAANRVAAGCGYVPDPGELSATAAQIGARAPGLARDRLKELAQAELCERWARATATPRLRDDVLGLALVEERGSDLAARARAKDRTLRDAGLAEVGFDELGLDRDALLRWWFNERLGTVVPADVAAYASGLGVGEVTFLRILRREHAFTRGIARNGCSYRVVSPVLGEVDAAGLLDVWRAGGPYEVMDKPEREGRAGTAAALHYAVRVNGHLVAGGTARSVYFRRCYAVGREPRVPGVEPLLWSRALREAAREVAGGGTVLEPAYVIANVMLPGQELAPHHDIPEFRGLDRSTCPGWLLVVAHRSRLFERWRAPVMTAVMYVGVTYEGGELVMWPDGPDCPPVEFPPEHDMAVMADVDKMLHGVRRISGGPPPPALGPGTRVRYVGHDRWVVERGDRMLAHYRTHELRFSVVWKTYAFPDIAARDAWRERRDLLTVERVLDVLTTELRARGQIGASAPRPENLGQMLIDEFVRVPPKWLVALE